MADQDLLQSWKEIAVHLGRSERTCRRWETEFKLPVHRMDGSGRGSVFAYKSELDRWMDKILSDGEEPSSVGSRPRYSKYLTLILAFLVVVAVALVMGLLIGRSEPEKQSSSTRATLAILPFTNNTGDENLDFWEIALADLLVNDLSQSRYLNVLSQHKVLLALRDLGQLDSENDNAIDVTEIAARTGVENVVVGSFVRAGQRFRISANIRHIPSGDSFVLPSVEASSEEAILPRIDELSTKIKNHLVTPVDIAGNDLDLEIGKITTSSLEAYRHFVDGRSSWLDGRATDAMESFEKAVAIDPEFAMAHNWLAGCYSSLPGYEDEAEKSRARAFEFSDHASPRERLYIRGQYYLYQGQRSWDYALDAFSELVKAYPDDEIAVQRLSYLFRLTEQWERCIETLESIDDGQIPSSQNVYLRQAYRAVGRYEAALEVARGPSSDQYPLEYRHQLALNLIFDRRFDAALLEADKMLERAPGHATAMTVKGDVHFYRSEWDQAEAYYRELLSPIGSEQDRLRLRFDGFRRLAGLYLARGQVGRALDCINQAIHEAEALGERRWLVGLRYKRAFILLTQGNISEAAAEAEVLLSEAERRNLVTGKLAALEIRGLTNLEAGNVGVARQTADEMKMEIEGWLNPKLMRRWHDFAGQIELAEENIGGAVDHFERGVPLLPHQYEPNGDAHAWYYNSLAYAYYLSGDLDRVQQWYENILALTTGRLGAGVTYAKSHFMLGQIYERRNMNAEAIQMYRAFLDLWREADLDTPELEEAKRALANLSD